MNIDKQQIIRIFPCCHITHGYSSGIISDPQRRNFFKVPLALLDIFECANEPYWQLISKMDDTSVHTVEEYLSFLEEHELIYNLEPEEESFFPSISMDWDYPGHIMTSIIVVAKKLSDYWDSIVEQLDWLLCHSLSLIINLWDKHLLNVIFEKLTYSSIESVILNIDLDDREQLNMEELYAIMQANRQIVKVIVWGSDSDEQSSKDSSIVFRVGHYSNNCCELNFVNNLPFFTEAQHHNTCLNRKICIDENGDIKNCPAMKKSYGNIRDTTLKEAIEKPGFKDCWTICKDQIDVCKDCEFRYMCTDCRAFIKDPANPYSQPAKCTYNPYICLWEGQAGYVPVEECGTYSRETGFVPDKKKIAELNKRIWNEEE